MRNHPIFADAELLLIPLAVVCLIGFTIAFLTAAFLLRKEMRAKRGYYFRIAGIILGLAIIVAWYLLLAHPELIGLRDF
jgi:hypothetical protein